MPTQPTAPATSPDFSALPDVLAFMQVMWALVHRLDQASKRMRHQVGVTGPQRLALRVVGLFPGISAGDVATVLHMHPSTLTGVLQRLVAQKLVVRRRDPNDRRRAVLQLTDRGRAVNAAIAGTVESAVARTLEGASRHDVAATTRLLVRLAHHLDAQGAATAPAASGAAARSRTRPTRPRTRPRS